MKRINKNIHQLGYKESGGGGGGGGVMRARRTCMFVRFLCVTYVYVLCLCMCLRVWLVCFCVFAGGAYIMSVGKVVALGIAPSSPAIRNDPFLIENL